MLLNKKILVINSPLFREVNPLYDEDSLPPIGLGLIASALKEIEYEVELIDAVALNIPLTDLIEKIRTIKPAFVCLNIFTTNYQLVKEIAESKLNTTFIIGGLSTKDLQKDIFKWCTETPIYVIHGDGEKIITDIVIQKVKVAPTEFSLNRFYFSIDTSSPYYVQDISTEKLDRSFFINEPVYHPLGFTEACIVTSRGCIYNCSFCAAARSVNNMLGTREKSAVSITLEIQHLINIYPGLKSIRVLDDLFLKSPKTIAKAIAVFKEFDLQWRAMAHVETFRNVDDATIKALKESGCNELFIGIESGSPRILKQIHKTHDIDRIKSNISNLLRNGINIKGYFIFGFPGETEEDFEMTYRLAEYLKNVSLEYGSVFRTSVFQYRPYHGTELFHKIEQNKKENVDKIIQTEPNRELSDLVGRIQFNFHSGNFSEAEIQLVQSYIYKTSNLNSLCIFGLNDPPNSNIKPNR